MDSDRTDQQLWHKKFSVGVFADLNKAFHAINHRTLNDKMERYGIRGVALNWLKS